MSVQKIVTFLLIGVAAACSANAAEVRQLDTRILETLPARPEGQMLTVAFAPGESSMPHRHDAHTFVYVLEGRVRMQVKGGNEVLLSAGDTFYESPTDIHVVSANASASDPAKILVFFVKEAGAAVTRPAK